MSDIAIKVENLSKLYRIGAHQESYRTLRDTLAGAASAPFRALRSAFKRSDAETSDRPNEFWALKDVSFEVRRGEVVGVIGRNGAGKSTLLKILSRITEPTSGYADIYGRVGSLLEVGTGFHQELTGRENTYLNGAILGMKRAEIDRRFDDIVEFADIEKFIDTPVKHYSSGMYLRLAFAVAAHLDPEILLVDEVLAVGDGEFQKKCLRKMGEVAAEGRTVLFVSHNMSAIMNLCRTGILLSSGKLSLSGDIQPVSQAYAREMTLVHGYRDLREIKQRTGKGGARLEHCTVLSEDDHPVAAIQSGKPLRIRVGFHTQDVPRGSYLAVQIYRYDGAPVCGFLSHLHQFELGPNMQSTYEVRVDSLPLNPSLYAIKLGICDKNDRLCDFVDPAIYFDVLPGLLYIPVFSDHRFGIANIGCEWSVVC